MPLVDTYTPKQVWYGAPPCRLSTGTVASGLNLPAGQVLGKITASGLLAAYNDANSDGTQTAVGILAVACNASSTGTNSNTEVAYYEGKEGVKMITASLTGLDANGRTDLGIKDSATIPGVCIL